MHRTLFPIFVLCFLILQSCSEEEKKASLPSTNTLTVIQNNDSLKASQILKDSITFIEDSIAARFEKIKLEKQSIKYKNQKLTQEIIKANLGESKEKTKVLIVPCSNCYTCNTKGYELVSIIEKVLKNTCPNIEIIPFSHKKFCKDGCHGIRNKEHARKMLALANSDFLISSKIEGKCTPYRKEKKGAWVHSNSGDSSWGYSIRITNSSSIFKKKVISAINLKFFENIEQHLLENKDKVLTNLK